ncbi:hypothetical protein KP79_PYT06612 [Mizuhopecten yessoensis]|uniref:Uncharacterized protein n=1 Tax=Mizuhopecten yessoensis TaxID=6573 RepID=A0A210Q5C4_MIZYE|nr:hypothetical protein KP79_PYT06612 [Mizuhopecten yessoensis]
MAGLTTPLVICAFVCALVSAITDERVAAAPVAEDSNQQGGRILKSLVKRWGEDMFGGCHCSWHVGCSSDTYCHFHHGHEYSCRPTCCGVECTHHGHDS